MDVLQCDIGDGKARLLGMRATGYTICNRICLTSLDKRKLNESREAGA